MMDRVLKGLGWLLAGLYTGIGLRWVLDPAGAAEGLGMTLLEGAGRASQMGDGGAFFLGAGVMTAVGLWRRIPPLLVAAGGLIGAVAPIRLWAWAVHDAALTPAPIVVEVVTLVVLLAAARAVARTPAPAAD
jgi:hypothetical protein